MTTIAANFTQPVALRAASHFITTLDRLAPLADLLLRLWVANAFFVSGMTKIASWDSTLLLFQYEYHVPLLPPALAAYMGTATELGMPVFLALGLGGRLAAAILFVFNIVAVLSYPDLMPAGLEQHQVWGLMLFAALARGPGRWSVDYRLAGRFGRRAN
ncbi:MAG: DoxX family protein [Gammaproteobacteria bacterium]|nr:DoxX family protein [Gammaproteobacteria bacterium]MBI5618576.1 DoxX family protein [Gammaproteobacteria bacterium]